MPTITRKLRRTVCLGLLAVAVLGSLHAQSRFWLPDSQPNPKRLGLALGGAGLAWAGSFTYLGLAWYGNAGWEPFRWFDDSGEWLQIDKMGHAYGAYQAGRGLGLLLRWSGMPQRQAMLWGALGGFAMQAPIEVLDGFSANYGASWADLAANTTGSLVLLANELLFRSQVIQPKWSFFPSPWASQAPDLLGQGAERFLKDYNGQQYWLGVNVNALLPPGKLKNRWPRWLGLAVGTGGEGMLGGYGREPASVIEAREYRQWYVGLDVDWTAIRTRSGALRLLFQVMNAFRFPLPCLRADRTGVALLPLGFE